MSDKELLTADEAAATRTTVERSRESPLMDLWFGRRGIKPSRLQDFMAFRGAI
ncbi:MAG: hypothetical protein V2B18_20840 [Pseudomonadota bacterium]